MKTILEIKDWLAEQAGLAEPTWFITGGEKGALIGILARAIQEVTNDKSKEATDNARHLVIGILFGDGKKRVMSTKELTDADWFALKAWIVPGKSDVTGVWTWGNQDLPNDILTILNEVDARDGQKQFEFEQELGRMMGNNGQ